MEISHLIKTDALRAARLVLLKSHQCREDGKVHMIPSRLVIPKKTGINQSPSIDGDSRCCASSRNSSSSSMSLWLLLSWTSLPLQPLCESRFREFSENFHLPLEREGRSVHHIPDPRPPDCLQARANKAIELELQDGRVVRQDVYCLVIKKAVEHKKQTGTVQLSRTSCCRNREGGAG